MATRMITGVLDDGTTRDPSVPDNARQVLRMTKGGTLVLILQVVRNDGSPVVLSSLPVLAVKRSGVADENELLITSTLAPERGENVALFVISATATKYMGPGRYVYDVWLDQDSSRDAIIPFSSFVLEPGLQLP